MCVCLRRAFFERLAGYAEEDEVKPWFVAVVLVRLRMFSLFKHHISLKLEWT